VSSDADGPAEPPFPKPCASLPDLWQSQMEHRIEAAHEAGYPIMIHESGAKRSIRRWQRCAAADGGCARPARGYPHPRYRHGGKHRPNPRGRKKPIWSADY
jgi:hypothetical protein